MAPTMDSISYSILLLKEDPIVGVRQIPSTVAGPCSDPAPIDPYRTALHAAFTQDNQMQHNVDYLAPMTTLFPMPTVLSEAILAGPPSNQGHDRIWAFAVTSQNAVQAIETALQAQTDSAIREAWLQVPIYCLTGATLTAVQRVGFKTINCSTLLARSSTSTQSTIPLSAPTPSIDNGIHLVDLLLSFEWPTAADLGFEDGPPPALWFLTGETHMKTLPETLSAHQKPFREIVVYEAGPRSGFESDLYAWLVKSSDSMQDGMMGKMIEGKKILYLAGFSPRGVDMTMPTLKQFLREYGSTLEDATIEIRWAAIGTTTAKRIQEHLSVIAEDSSTQDSPATRSNVIINSVVAVASGPNATSMAEVILSHIKE
ncbi:hypothetical protein BG011_007586 [Mortierella polycephala]|uniref:Tetrapyrrole biosynthesis uroporphyrinogen III synthase domain-containing protein n=1 Tax=Mortierella polycephala TaxID=41804 RepID=A0A9P6TXJ2_9FUNG|nr:hypothetical protein BG011_007586 [Mortierella polycephala]